MKRVYHPELDSWNDVPDDKVDEWAEAGWLKTKPQHVHIPEETPAPGEHPGIAAVAVEVPLLEDTSATTTSTRGARRSSGGSRSRGSRASRTASTATSSTDVGTTPTT